MALVRSGRVRLVTAALVALIVAFAGCAPTSLVTEEYDPAFYEVSRQLPDSLETETTNFVVVGDVQSGWRAERKFYRRHNWATWKQLLFPFYQLYLLGNGFVGAANYKLQLPDYGTQERDMMRRAVADAMERTDAQFFMILGDLAAHDGRRAEHWAAFLREYRSPTSELAGYPLLPVVGNHEYANDSTGMANFLAVFDYPPFYVQDTPHAAIFVLNSNYIIDQHGFLDGEVQDRLWHEWFIAPDTSDERAWLERELERRKDRPFKMVAMHHPLITLAWHSEDWHESHHGPNLIEKRNRLLQLLQRYDVQIVFSGHEHLYEHDLLRYRLGNEDKRLIHQVITSGGGVPVRPIATRREYEERMEQYEEEGLDVYHVLQRSVYHYTTVAVTRDTLRIDTYEVDRRMPPEATLMDRILIPRPREVAGTEAQPARRP